MYTVLTILHFVVCIFLILVVLLQAGKGGGMGIAFGGGGSQTVFGSSGAGNFLTRLTAICATIFFINSLALAYLSSQSDSKRLQGLADRKTAEKAAQQAANDKVTKDLEKARQEIDKNKAAQSTPPASGAAPATTPAPATPAPAAAPAAAPDKGSTTTSPAKPRRAPKPTEKPASDNSPATPTPNP